MIYFIIYGWVASLFAASWITFQITKAKDSHQRRVEVVQAPVNLIICAFWPVIIIVGVCLAISCWVDAGQKAN